MNLHAILRPRWLAVGLILLLPGNISSHGAAEGTSTPRPRPLTGRHSRADGYPATVTVSLVREARLSVGDSGLVTKLHVRDGQEVKAGDLVLSLDDRQQQQRLSAARLNLEMAKLHAQDETAIRSAEAQLREAESGQRLKEISLKIAEAEADNDVAIRIAEAETKLRQMELERAQGARKSFKGSISESQIDRLKTSVEKGKLERQAAHDQLLIAGMKPDAERAAIDQKKDEVRRYEALLQQKQHERQLAELAAALQSNEVQAAELQLERRLVHAPFDGVAVETSTEVGEWVEAGTVIARLLDLQTLQVEGFLPVTTAGRNLVGRKLHVRLSTGDSVQATVVYVSPEVDSINQQVRFRAEFENVDRVALPGMKGTAVFSDAETDPDDTPRR